MIVIHVQSNELRKLKRPASRRVLPLVEELSKFEWSLIHQFIAQAELCRPDKGTFALFSLNSKGARFDVKSLSANINQILGRVCGDPNTTFYKARHGFANRMADALIGPDLGYPKQENKKTEQDISAHVTKLMLGTTYTTRRAPWVSAPIEY